MTELVRGPGHSLAASVWAFLWSALLSLSCTAPVPPSLTILPAPTVQPRSRPRPITIVRETRSLEVNLASWGMLDSSEIAFASVRVLRDGGALTLELEELRGEAPRRSKASLWRSEAPPLEDGLYIITHFDAGTFNRLGGSFDHFGDPELGSAELQHKRRRLKFRFHQGPQRQGVRVNLFNDRVAKSNRSYLHPGAAKYLRFDIRGRRGGEELSLGIADRQRVESQDASAGDALRLGHVSSFLESGRIATTWQTVFVPVEALPTGLEASELAALELSVSGGKSGSVFVRNLALSLDRTTVLISPKRAHKEPRDLRTAMWVWQTRKIIESVAETQKLVDYSAREGLTEVFLQVPKSLGKTSSDGLWRTRHLIAALHAKGIRVEALDGSPHFALEENHAEVLRSVAQIVAYNDRVRKIERFDGVRFDNEPYLLPAFAGPLKEVILRQYLDLLSKLRRVTKDNGLSLGADIPFWFDVRDRYQEPVNHIDGRPISELVIDMVDSISVMAYRTKVYGNDGVIAHCLDEVEYAQSRRKGVYVGLETIHLPDEELVEFVVDRGNESGNEGDWLVVTPGDDLQAQLHWFEHTEETVAREFAESTSGHLLGQHRSLRAPASKMTFQEKGREKLNQAMSQIRAELWPYRSFLGFSLHAYGSLKALPMTR